MAATLDRGKALDMALAQIDKQFGKGSVMRLGDDAAQPIKVIPTGSIALDIALGIGGLPRGRVIEVYGPESSGKTTVALHAVANAQAAGGIAAFIDAEHALDPEYARAIGVDTDALLVSQPDTGEQALEIADMLIRSGALDIIVIDSVAALVPRAEIEGEMGDSHVGLQARLMSQALRKITGALSHSGTTAVFINQLREKVGVVYGSPEVTTGGKALKFYASIRLDVRRIESLKEDRKSTRLNSSHANISYAVFCLKKKNRTSQRSEAVNGDRRFFLTLSKSAPFLPAPPDSLYKLSDVLDPILPCFGPAAQFWTACE